MSADKENRENVVVGMISTTPYFTVLLFKVQKVGVAETVGIGRNQETRVSPISKDAVDSWTTLCGLARGGYPKSSVLKQ